MAQSKDFCLKGSSRTERITEENEHGNQDRGHRQEAYRCTARSAIGTARIEFLVGTGSSNIEVAHHLSEHEEQREYRMPQAVEIAEAIVLAVVAITTAWSGSNP